MGLTFGCRTHAVATACAAGQPARLVAPSRPDLYHARARHRREYAQGHGPRLGPRLRFVFHTSTIQVLSNSRLADAVLQLDFRATLKRVTHPPQPLELPAPATTGAGTDVNQLRRRFALTTVLRDAMARQLEAAAS